MSQWLSSSSNSWKGISLTSNVKVLLYISIYVNLIPQKQFCLFYLLNLTDNFFTLQVDLADIKDCYVEKHDSKLGSIITEETRGDYRRILLRLLGYWNWEIHQPQDMKAASLHNNFVSKQLLWCMVNPVRILQSVLFN
jgi:hypothetical protein